MRVYELAKELGLTAKEAMEVLARLKLPVKSHSSSLTMAAVERLRAHIAATRPKGKKGVAAPAPSAPAAPPAPVRPDSKTPTGERILGLRKIVIPPPAPVEAPVAAAPPEASVAPAQAVVPPIPESPPAGEAPAPREVVRPAA